MDYNNLSKLASAYRQVLTGKKEEELTEEVISEEETLEEKRSCKKEDNTNDVSDDGEGVDKVQPKALKKKFKDRKDKDIDNDGDEDESDEYLHNRRKAVTKAVNKEEVETEDEEVIAEESIEEGKLKEEECPKCGEDPCVCDDDDDDDDDDEVEEGMKSYKVNIAGRGFATVQARSEKEAQEKAMRKMGIGGVGKKRLKGGKDVKIEAVSEDYKKATPGPNDVTRDNWVDQLMKRKGEKDFVDMHEPQTPEYANGEAVNMKTFKAFTDQVNSPNRRPGDNASGDTNIVKSEK